ncbi:hypothetical protein BKA59DRAFT_182510 [Fusarium tricinctum]|uniref:Uncharacterized protein n=1 Tax=Fusarium tricinctum TaxID=61284 RepID=A0A8K0RWB1_9HYPO|nr:hypothetical protein BKA59DRAFT_182510 [Fusarium tricinctum]
MSCPLLALTSIPLSLSWPGKPPGLPSQTLMHQPPGSALSVSNHCFFACFCALDGTQHVRRVCLGSSRKLPSVNQDAAIRTRLTHDRGIDGLLIQIIYLNVE